MGTKVEAYKRKKELLALGVPEEVIDNGFDNVELYLKLKEMNLPPTIWYSFYSKKDGVAEIKEGIIKNVREGESFKCMNKDGGRDYFKFYSVEFDGYNIADIPADTLTGSYDLWGHETCASIHKEEVEEWCDDKLAEHFVNVTNKSEFELKVEIRISKSSSGVIRYTLDEILEALNNKEASLDEKHLIIRKKDGAVMGEFIGYKQYVETYMIAS